MSTLAWLKIQRKLASARRRRRGLRDVNLEVQQLRREGSPPLLKEALEFRPGSQSILDGHLLGALDQLLPHPPSPTARLLRHHLWLRLPRSAQSPKTHPAPKTPPRAASQAETTFTRAPRSLDTRSRPCPASRKCPFAWPSGHRSPAPAP